MWKMMQNMMASPLGARVLPMGWRSFRVLRLQMRDRHSSALMGSCSVVVLEYVGSSCKVLQLQRLTVLIGTAAVHGPEKAGALWADQVQTTMT